MGSKLSKSEESLANATPFDKKELERIRSLFVSVRTDNELK